MTPNSAEMLLICQAGLHDAVNYKGLTVLRGNNNPGL